MMHQSAPASRSARHLLSSCATTLILAALAQGVPARAQVSALQGAGTVDAGFASIDNSGGTAAAPRTNVQVFSPNAVINWTPSDTAAGATPIDFLPANGLAYFYSTSDPNFIVLNRVLPATMRQIGLNGEVRSNVDVSGSTSPGGNVWFYSPTGFVAGTGSRFATNGLILTANDIAYTTGGSGGGITFGQNGEFQMTAAAGSQANVTLLPGARISNTSDDAYTLIVAPSIVQGGTIELDGSVGLVAAQSVSVVIQNSLFDIDVQVGTSVANAIVHSGSTGAGATGDPLSGAQQVVVLATPANTALTVLLGGNLGATAVNAATADRAVILSGGYDYAAVSAGGLAAAPDTTTPVDFQIGTTSFISDLTALTTGSITGSPSRGTAIDFLGSASLTAGTTASLTADLDEAINASSDLALLAPISATLKLGTINAEAGAGNSAARIDVTGDLTVSTDVIGLDPLTDAAAGIATIALDAGAVGPLLTVTGTTTVSASAFGAESPGLGGNGIGGTAQIIADGGTLTLGNVQIFADGSGAAGTPGGSGTGGLAQFVATDPQGYTMGDLTIRANGSAGDSTDPTTPFGTGTGGTARFLNQGAAASAPGGRVVGNLTLEASGSAGLANGQPGFDSVAGLTQLSDLATGANGHARFAGVFGQSFGETVAAGSGALLEVAGGTTAIDTTLDIGSSGAITVAAGGIGSFNAADAVALRSGRDIVVTHVGQGVAPTATLFGGGVTVDADQSVSAGPGSLISAGSTLVVTARTGTATLDSLAAADDLEVHARGNAFLGNAATTAPPSGGRIYVTAGIDPVELVGGYAPADITIGGSVNASGLLDLHAGRDILGSGASLLEGQSASVIAERDIAGADLAIRSRGDLALGVAGSLTAGTIDVASRLNMVDFAGSVIQADRLNVAGNLAVSNLTLRGPTPALVRAAGNLTIGRASTTGLDVATPGGVLTLGGLQAYPGGPSGFLSASAPTLSLAEIAVTGNIAATATASSLTASNLTAGGAVALDARTDITATNLLQGATVTVTAPGAMSFGSVNVTAGNFSATPGGALSLQNATVSGSMTLAGAAVTLGGAEAGGPLSVATRGAFTANGQITAPTIRIGSSDVVIGGAGRIGAAGTTSLVELTNTDAARRSYYGGLGNVAGYSLSGAEMGQFAAGAITLIAPQTALSSAAAPDVTIGEMTVTGAQLGPQGALTVQTPGRVLINGVVKFTGLSNANTFAIRAGDLIALDNQTGAIDLRGTGNALAGRIDFAANTIVAASGPAQTALAGLSDPAAIDRLLGSNGGKVSESVLAAESMRFAVSNGLYIQNTGAGSFYPLRRGFAVGAGGLAVSTSVTRGTPIVVINGQATASAATPAFGLEAIPLVPINGQSAPSSTGSAAGSTINGCDFTAVDQCRPPLTPELTLTRDRVHSPLAEITDTPSDIAVERQSLATPGVDLQDIGRLSYEPLIDEPVTGSGNDDLWVPECDAAKGNCPAP